MTNQKETIREHNDRFRSGDQAIPGSITLTSGVAALLAEHGADPLAVVAVVQAFDTFTEDNDPHGEHDFGAFEFLGACCFWKLDLYNQALDAYSDDPTDPAVTHRVLTIMLAEEY